LYQGLALAMPQPFRQSEGAGAFRLLKSPCKIIRPSGPEFDFEGAFFEGGERQLKSLEMFNFVRPGPCEMVKDPFTKT
jgi:hypothetical protein